MTMRSSLLAATISGVALITTACDNSKPPLTTDVGLSVATLHKMSGLIDVTNNCNTATPPAPDPQGWWNGMPPANHRFPFAGFQLWRNTFDGCTSSRVDAYRALVTFNMASVSNLKGLVQKAELIIQTRALPDSAGKTTGTGGTGVSCPMFVGGAGALQRFGPAAAGSLPSVSGTGQFHILQGAAAPFPTATNTVFTFPAIPAGGTIPVGAIPGASDPTTIVASGGNGMVTTTDVTSQVNAALNGGHAGMSWMLTSSFETIPAGAPVPSGRALDCRTSYQFTLRITHL
jgi:hypothetical protein